MNPPRRSYETLEEAYQRRNYVAPPKLATACAVLLSAAIFGALCAKLVLAILPNFPIWPWR